jgi:hypothetical protein
VRSFGVEACWPACSICCVLCSQCVRPIWGSRVQQSAATGGKLPAMRYSKLPQTDRCVLHNCPAQPPTCDDLSQALEVLHGVQAGRLWQLNGTTAPSTSSANISLQGTAQPTHNIPSATTRLLSMPEVSTHFVLPETASNCPRQQAQCNSPPCITTNIGPLCLLSCGQPTTLTHFASRPAALQASSSCMIRRSVCTQGGGSSRWTALVGRNGRGHMRSAWSHGVCCYDELLHWPGACWRHRWSRELKHTDQPALPHVTAP